MMPRLAFACFCLAVVLSAANSADPSPQALSAEDLRAVIRAHRQKLGLPASDMDDCTIRERLAKITRWSQELRHVPVPEYSEAEAMRMRQEQAAVHSPALSPSKYANGTSSLAYTYKHVHIN